MKQVVTHRFALWHLLLSQRSMMPMIETFTKSISDIISRRCVYASFYTNGADDLLNSDAEN